MFVRLFVYFNPRPMTVAIAGVWMQGGRRAIAARRASTIVAAILVWRFGC
jgi:hypothetical protein